MMNKVFVLGSLNMDFIITVDQMPKLGETIQGHGFQSSPGGKGSNQAVALAKQGAETYMIGSVGNDMIGDDILQSLHTFHVHDDFVYRLNNQTSGVALIVIEEDDNRIITNAGANAVHDIDSIKAIIDQYANQGDYLLAQLEVPMDIIEASFAFANQKGMTTILNAAPFRKLSHQFLKGIDMLIVNETEAEQLLNKTIDIHQIEEYMTLMLQLGPKEVILTLGKAGSYYSNGLSTIFTPAYKVEKVIDTTGAGDAFIGCFLANKLKKKSIETSLKYATACSALTIQKKGVHHAIPDIEQLESFYRKRGA